MKPEKDILIEIGIEIGTETEIVIATITVIGIGTVQIIGVVLRLGRGVGRPRGEMSTREAGLRENLKKIYWMRIF